MADDVPRDLSGLETGGIHIRDYESGDDNAIQAVFDEVFGVERTVEDWRWRFLREPYGRAQIGIMEADGVVVGHVAAIDLPVWIDHARAWLTQGGDYMLLEAYRGRGITEVLREAARRFPQTTEVSMSFPEDRVAERRLRLNEKGLVLTKLPQWVRWRTAAAARQSAGGNLPAGAAPLVQVALRASASAARRPRGHRVITPQREATSEFDDLADRSADFARSIRIRDRNYVQWRWFDQPGERWTVATAREAGRLTGWVVYGRSPFDEPGAAHVADLLADDHGTTRALLAHAADELEAAGNDVVAFDYLDPRPWAASACYRAGFLPRGTGPNLMFRARNRELAEAVGRLECWYLTIGDSDLA